jgi:hypothetical protein
MVGMPVPLVMAAVMVTLMAVVMIRMVVARVVSLVACSTEKALGQFHGVRRSPHVGVRRQESRRHEQHQRYEDRRQEQSPDGPSLNRHSYFPLMPRLGQVGRLTDFRRL